MHFEGKFNQKQSAYKLTRESLTILSFTKLKSWWKPC